MEVESKKPIKKINGYSIDFNQLLGEGSTSRVYICFKEHS
jgi:hypothetical protein